MSRANTSKDCMGGIKAEEGAEPARREGTRLEARADKEHLQDRKRGSNATMEQRLGGASLAVFTAGQLVRGRLFVWTPSEQPLACLPVNPQSRWTATLS